MSLLKYSGKKLIAYFRKYLCMCRQGRSQDFTMGATEAERRRRENRGAKGTDRGEDWGGGVPLSNRLGVWGAS